MDRLPARQRHSAAHTIGNGPHDSAAYNPWGSTTATTGTLPALGYQGGYTDPATGLVYMGARWYNPATGGLPTATDTITTTSAPGNGTPATAGDPLAATGPGLGYASDNPLTTVDPGPVTCSSHDEPWRWGIRSCGRPRGDSRHHCRKQRRPVLVAVTSSTALLLAGCRTTTSPTAPGKRGPMTVGCGYTSGAGSWPSHLYRITRRCLERVRLVLLRSSASTSASAVPTGLPAGQAPTGKRERGPRQAAREPGHHPSPAQQNTAADRTEETI